MAKLLDQIVVIDLESTCWEGDPPQGQVSEIIEIGICLVDVGNGNRAGKESLLVKPASSSVSEFCTKLTTLTQAQVNAGTAFKDACFTLKKRFKSSERVWASYGDYDRRQFERQCKAVNVGYPFGPTHLNVKNLFALTQGLSREVGMDEALKLLGLPLEGTHHRGGDDAWNIGLILSKVLLNARGGGVQRRA